MMEITENKYTLRYDASTFTIICEGIMDLRDKGDYASLLDLFSDVIDQEPETITFDMRGLKFLNSSGITAIGVGLVLKTRNKGMSKLVVRCSEKYEWQEKTMRIISKLMPGIVLKYG